MLVKEVTEDGNACSFWYIQYSRRIFISLGIASCRNQVPFLLTCFESNATMDKWWHTEYSVRWNSLCIPKLQWLHRWNLGMDKYFHPTLHNECNCLSVLIKVNPCKRGPRYNPISQISFQLNSLALKNCDCHSTCELSWETPIADGATLENIRK